MTLDEIRAAKARAGAVILPPEVRSLWAPPFAWDGGYGIEAYHSIVGAEADKARITELLNAAWERCTHAREDVSALAEECLRLRDVLESLEWASSYGGHFWCPSCDAAAAPTMGGRKPGNGAHYDDCALAGALR